MHRSKWWGLSALLLGVFVSRPLPSHAKSAKSSCGAAKKAPPSADQPAQPKLLTKEEVAKQNKDILPPVGSPTLQANLMTVEKFNNDYKTELFTDSGDSPLSVSATQQIWVFEWDGGEIPAALASEVGKQIEKSPSDTATETLHTIACFDANTGALLGRHSSYEKTSQSKEEPKPPVKPPAKHAKRPSQIISL